METGRAEDWKAIPRFHGNNPTEDALLQAAVRAGNSSRVALRYLEREGFTEKVARLDSVSGEQLRKVAARLGKSIRSAAVRIQERLPSPEGLFSAESVEAEVGGLGDQHGFKRHEAEFLPDLHEPQLTVALANALHARGDPLSRLRRIRTFLVALGVRQGLLASLDQWQQSPERISVLAESKTDKNRRMDLLITWPVWERPRDGKRLEGGVVIEAKFDADLQNNQLEAYTDWAMGQLSCDYRDLVFLTPTGMAAPELDQGRKKKRPEKWRAVSWRRLLRCWEALLEDPAGDLGVVKNLIWRKVG